MSARKLLISMTVAALAGGTAYADGPAPREEMARAHTLVEQADKAGAQRYAAADLQRAHDELAAADAAASAHKFDVARADAESAAVDADLASARAAAGEAQKAAHEVATGTESLRTEADRAADAAQATPPPTVVTTPH